MWTTGLDETESLVSSGNFSNGLSDSLQLPVPEYQSLRFCLTPARLSFFASQFWPRRVLISDWDCSAAQRNLPQIKFKNKGTF